LRDTCPFCHKANILLRFPFLSVHARLHIYIYNITFLSLYFAICSVLYTNTECPTTYQNWHFFNNSKTNEDIATRFEQEYVRCVRNEEECVCRVCLFRSNIFIWF